MNENDKKRIGYWRDRRVTAQEFVDSLPGDESCPLELQGRLANVRRFIKEGKYKNDVLPWPEEGNLPQETKDKLVEYLNGGKQAAAWMGISSCRLCGKNNGSTCMTRDQFIYPEGYAHYIKEHNIMPDLDLLAHVLTMK